MRHVDIFSDHKRVTVSFTLNRENARTAFDMMWMDSSESYNPRVRQVARVIIRAIRKGLRK